MTLAHDSDNYKPALLTCNHHSRIGIHSAAANVYILCRGSTFAPLHLAMVLHQIFHAYLGSSIACIFATACHSRHCVNNIYDPVIFPATWP